MQRTRRRFLSAGVLAAAVTAGCLDGSDGNGNGGGGGGDGGGGLDPTSAVIEQPRIDRPPYTIVAQTDDEADWNELYLCENMPNVTYLEVEPVSAPELAAPLLPSENQRGEEYAVRALTSEEAVQEVFETGEGGSDGGGSGDDGSSDDGDTDDGSGEPLAETDFEEHVLLVVESGYVSGSLSHHWKRVRTIEGGLWLQGCYRVPYVRSDDETARHSVVRVERPEDFELARVSLTINEDERVHVNSTEGVVAIERDASTPQG